MGKMRGLDRRRLGKRALARDIVVCSMACVCRCDCASCVRHVCVHEDLCGIRRQCSPNPWGGLPWAQNKASLRMGLESITDTDGPLGGLKWVGFFGASFLPSLFLCGYFLGGYFPGGIEPSWWPTSMQVPCNRADSRPAHCTAASVFDPADKGRKGKGGGGENPVVVGPGFFERAACMAARKK
jgi:hypothetical protein